MLVRNLQQNLITKVDEYLTKENLDPEKASFFTNAANFFTRHGEEGRLRAKNYLQTLQTTSEDELLAKVYGDIIQRTESLGSSRLLKKYLIQGIFESIQNKEQLEENTQQVEGKKEVDLEELNQALYKHLNLDYIERASRIHKKYNEQCIDIPTEYAMYNSGAFLGVAIHNWSAYSRIEEDVMREMIFEKLSQGLPKVEKETQDTPSVVNNARL